MSISITTKLATVTTAFFLSTGITEKTSAADNVMVPLPQELEIKLALSALPTSLREEATILVLDQHTGYKTYRKGKNGFTTFVGRTSTRFYQADWEYKYPADQLIPVAFDKVGAAAHMLPWMDIARMRAQGMPAAEAKKHLREAFENGTYKAPNKGGISYMLAPIHRAYMAPEKNDKVFTVSFPHYMPYAPHVTGRHLGSFDPSKGMPIALTHGMHEAGPHGYLVFKLPDEQIRAIQLENTGLLEELCKLHSNWCIDNGG